MVAVRSATTSAFTPAGSASPSCGSRFFMLIDRADDVGAGLALHVDDDGGRAVVAGGCAFHFPAPPTMVATSRSSTGAPLA